MLESFYIIILFRFAPQVLSNRENCITNRKVVYFIEKVIMIFLCQYFDLIMVDIPLIYKSNSDQPYKEQS